MPFRAMVQDGVLTSDDLDFLQEIYDTATADISNVDDGMMHDVVKTLIVHYSAGERDRDKLIDLARQDLRRDVG
jgi:hypothetical protein